MQIFGPLYLREDITKFIRDWFKLLAYHKYEQAAQLLDQDAQDLEPPKLDGAFFEEVLNTYYWDGYVEGQQTCLSDPYLLDLHLEIVYFHEHKLGIEVEYRPPINNVWSDLTAQFTVRKASDEYYAIYFRDMHVL